MDPAAQPQTVTRMLQAVRAGNARAGDTLLDFVYAELGALARVHLGHRPGHHTLQPTALVHEAWLKFADHIEHIEDRTHFFAIASRAMRQVLSDHTRGKNRLKRQGGHLRISLEESLESSGTDGLDLVDLEDSLNKLSALNERHARIVELRIFGGLTIAEAAEFLAVSHSTVETDWFMAKAWLRRELSTTT